MSEAVEVEAGRPEWLPDKFATPEAFGRSYTELESKMTQLAQQNKEQAEQFEAYLAEEAEAEPPGVAPQGRGQTLASMQRLAEQSAYMGAQRVVGAISAGRVPAPDDPAAAARLATEMVAQMDERWDEASPELVARAIEQYPGLLPERMDDMSEIVQGLRAAGEVARGVQADQALQDYRRGEDHRQMKLNAATLTGAGGRMDAGEDDWWSNIKQAADRSYSSIRGNP